MRLVDMILDIRTGFEFPQLTNPRAMEQGENLKKMKIQLTISKLEAIIQMAKGFKELDNSLSDTLEFELKKEGIAYLGSDTVSVWQKSGYAECNGKQLI